MGGGESMILKISSKHRASEEVQEPKKKGGLLIGKTARESGKCKVMRIYQPLPHHQNQTITTKHC